MSYPMRRGATSRTINVFLQDSSKTDGSGLTGLAFNSSGLVCSYTIEQQLAVSVTLANLTNPNSAWSSGGFKEIDSAKCPGLYRFDIPDAALASGNSVTLFFQGATNLAPDPVRIPLWGPDPTDAAAFGLTDFDATVSSRAPASTALSNVQWTNTRAANLDNLDATISSRSPATTALSNVVWTNTRAGLLDHLDADVSSRAPAATALSTVNWTPGRAAALDNLDATVSSRAPAATALSTAQWTNTRAGLLDHLDADVSSRSTYAGTDTPGTATLLGRLSSARAGYLDNLGAALAESYPPLHGQGTFAQLLYAIYGAVMSFDVTGTALTVRGVDGASAALVCTLNDATNPTSRVRTS